MSPFSIFILPYVSIISEKEKRFEKIFKVLPSALGISEQESILRLKMQSIHSSKRALINKDTNLVICTIEKANQLIN